MAEERKVETVDRMSLWQRAEHGLLALCVLVLIATGLARHYRLAGPDGTLQVHKVAAVGLIAAGVLHLAGLLLSKSHKKDFGGLAFHAGDMASAWRGASYELTGRGEPPRYGRFTPMQKLQYWGIVLGCLLMAASGLLLWAGPGSLSYEPLWLRNLELVLHSNQAQLIFVVLILWHLYDVHMASGNFPMNPAWLTGKMRADIYRRQHRSEAEEGNP